MDSSTSDRPEKQTAIIARELRRCRIDIAVLPETRRTDEGQLKEEKGGYTFFWTTTSFSTTSQNFLWASAIMTICLVLANNQTATVVTAYAPTLDSDVEEKEAFYACLEETQSKIPREDKIILLGDFSARVGRDQFPHSASESCTGSGTHGYLTVGYCVGHGCRSDA